MWKYVAEFVASFVFLSIIFRSANWGTSIQPILISVGLLAAVVIAGKISGCHVNGTISTLMYLTGDKNVPDVTSLAGYLVAQFAGMYAAWWVHQQTKAAEA